MIRRISKIFGLGLVLFGFLGFINNPIVGSSGVFYTNSILNIIYIILGSILIFKIKNNLTLTLKVVGMAYLALAILGFVVGTQNKLLGIIAVNSADNWLHLGLAVILFTISISESPSHTSSKTTQV